MKKFSNTDVLIIFVKNLELGNVKTRLANLIGDQNALIVYEALVDKTRETIEPLNVKKAIYYSNYIDEYDKFSNDKFSKRLQLGDDLGNRMQNTFQSVFNLGFKKAVIIGSDCWDLTPEIIEVAFEELDSHDFVLGPAVDGGYYLMGMKEMLSDVFNNKQWSTANVLVDTLIDIDNASKTKALLPTLSDVDYLSDLPAELKLLIE
ncbi:MAG: TIGR04282 family arsenosugar biosynthesis glycosyltransferase [Flavobacteriales bacterium]|nr:TIGR04282 family arsenosugar biosynthesis glycosyltransferase [Flavobacteriales bacterium]